MVFSLFIYCLLPSDVLGRISFVNPKLSQLCKEKQRSRLGVLSGLGQVLNGGRAPPPAMVTWYWQGGEEIDRLRPAGSFICVFPPKGCLCLESLNKELPTACFISQQNRLTRKCPRERLLIHFIKGSKSKGDLCQSSWSHCHQS